MAMDPDGIRPKRRRRWLLGVIGVVVVLAVSPIVAVPMFLNSGAGRRYLLQRADRALGPGRLEVASFRFSWFGPTRMTGFVLKDANGLTVVDVAKARWDRNLRQVLFDKLHRGTLDLQSTAERRALIVIRRDSNGNIGLYETLKPILNGDPRTDVSVSLRDGRIEVEDPGFSKPWTGQIQTLSLHIASIPKPVAWDLAITGSDGATFASRGTVDHPKRNPKGEPAALPNLATTVTIGSWPLNTSRSGVTARGLLASRLAVDYAGGRWKTSGDLTAENLKFGGKALAGDTLALGNLQANWNAGFARDFSDARIQSLDLKVPMGRLGIQGPIPPAPGATSTVEGTLDLAPIVAQLPHLFRTSDRLAFNSGVLHLKAEAKGDGAKAPASWSIRANVNNLAATVDGEAVALDSEATLRATLSPADAKGRLPLDVRLDVGENPWLDGPVALAVDGGYFSRTDRLELAQVTFQSGEGNATLSGFVDHLTTRRDADLNARWEPDWDAINAILARRIEPGASLEGGPISMHLVGPLANLAADEIPRELDIQIHAPITHADVYGLNLGAVNIAARSEHGRLTVEPIETTLNGGALHLEPMIDRNTDGDGLIVRLGEESTIDNARINDEVSHRVLSFLVPFMANATRATGTLDVQVTRAEFPIASAERKTLVEGEVVFNDVEFAPGPIFEELFAGFGPLRRQARPNVLRINHPVLLSIHDGRVYQHGLALPLGDVSEIALDGTVGFDKSIDLRVSLPITAAMFGGPNPLGGDGGNFGGNLTKLTLPITGTLSKPKIDPDAFKTAMQQTGRDLLQNGIFQGAGDLLQLFSRPRDPNAPPPPTPEERRALRAEKKRERQLRREMRRNGGLVP